MEEESLKEKIFQEQALAGQMSDTSAKQMAQQFILEEKEKSMIHEQLDLTEEILRIEHLLRGHVQQEKDGILTWVETNNPDMQIFTEYGIHLILNSIAWYINKNTLLSNYDDKTILLKMHNFAHALNDTIYMQYEKVFKIPSMEECKQYLEIKIKKEIDSRILTYEITGRAADKIQIDKDVREEVRLYLNIIDELKKIKEQIMKSRMARYMLLIREVQDAVHSTYNRAYQGQERKTLREHTMLSETRGLDMVPNKGGGLFKWLRGG